MDHYKNIVISDLHLGNPHSNWNLLKTLLENISCNNIFLNGDIIDENYLLNSNKELSLEEKYFFKYLLNKSDNVYYIVGNHENIKFPKDTTECYWEKYNIKVYKYFLYETYKDFGRHFISHGHDTVFSNPIVNKKYIIKTIDYLIRLFSKFQKYHMGIIFKEGKFVVNKGDEYKKLSNRSKSFFQNGLKIISNFNYKLQKYRKIFYADAIICGHIHKPEIKKYKSKYIKNDDFLYLNSGDWIDNNSILAQNERGEWKIIKYLF